MCQWSNFLRPRQVQLDPLRVYQPCHSLQARLDHQWLCHNQWLCHKRGLQQLEAWKLEMENKTPAKVLQPQVQASPIISSSASGPVTNGNDLRDVDNKSGRSASSKRSRSGDLPGLKQQHPTDPSLPKGTAHEGLVLLLSQLRPVLRPSLKGH